MRLTLKWHIGAEAAYPKRLDRAPEKIYFYLKRHGAEGSLDGRSLSVDDLRQRVERLGEAAPQVFKDAFDAVEGRRRERRGEGPATPEALEELGMVSPSDVDAG